MVTTDSIVIADTVSRHQQDTISDKPKQLTVAQVLKWLPKDATPAQQDSMVQAHFKPKPIRWSNEPDTLHLPGHPIGKSYRDVSLPQYYKESFFSNDSLFHPELPGGRIGVAGDPVPYSVTNDDLLSILFIGSFILALFSFSKTKDFITRQIKKFFYIPRSKTTVINETPSELRYQMFFVLQTCMLFSVVGFFYTHTYITDIFIIEPYQVMGIYTIGLILFFLLKCLIYSFVNWTFFDRTKNEHWQKARLFLISAEGVALFPIVLLASYFNISIDMVLTYTIIVIILVKTLMLFKQYIIFFRNNNRFLQIFLYFCMLEIIPLIILWGIFGMVNSYLKVNF